MIYREELQHLHKIVSKSLDENQKDRELLNIKLSPVLFFKHLSFALNIMIFATCIGYTIMPIINMLTQYFFHPQNFKYVLPTTGIFPYTIIDGTWNYYLHYLIESYFFFCVFTIVGGVDNLMAFYASHVVGEFQVLIYKISHLNFDKGINEELKQIVMKHNELLMCCEKIEHICGPIVLVTVISTSAIVCVLIFQLNKVHCIL